MGSSRPPGALMMGMSRPPEAFRVGKSRPGGAFCLGRSRPPGAFRMWRSASWTGWTVTTLRSLNQRPQRGAWTSTRRLESRLSLTTALQRRRFRPPESHHRRRPPEIHGRGRPSEGRLPARGVKADPHLPEAMQARATATARDFIPQNVARRRPPARQCPPRRRRGHPSERHGQPSARLSPPESRRRRRPPENRRGRRPPESDGRRPQSLNQRRRLGCTTRSVIFC